MPNPIWPGAEVEEQANKFTNVSWQRKSTPAMPTLNSEYDPGDESTHVEMVVGEALPASDQTDEQTIDHQHGQHVQAAQHPPTQVGLRGLRENTILQGWRYCLFVRHQRSYARWVPSVARIG